MIGTTSRRSSTLRWASTRKVARIVPEFVDVVMVRLIEVVF